jgi:uncharacterized protein YceK
VKLAIFLLLLLAGCAQTQGLTAQQQAAFQQTVPTPFWDQNCKGYIGLAGLPVAVWTAFPILDQLCPGPAKK